jgi:hypothetical protein
MNHRDILSQSATLLRSRSELHGQEEDVMDRACKIFENITGIEMSLYEGAMFMHSYEMARMKKNRRNMQGLMSSIDYLALSGQFAAGEIETVAEDTEESIRQMAAKLAPIPRLPVTDPPRVDGEG